MKYISSLVCAALFLTGCHHATEKMRDTSSMKSSTDHLSAINAATPAMADYSERFIRKDLWQRKEMSPRDRSLVTIASLISRNDETELAGYIRLGLDNGLTPTEISETITHLAFYAGWPNASSAAVVANSVYIERKIDMSTIPGANVKLLPINVEAENKRSALVSGNFGTVAPGVVKYTTDALFNDLWLRPGLAPRDRSLITVSALVTNGQVAQVPFHLNRAMDNGLTTEEASEILTQLAFVCGWPNVFSAMPVFKEVFGSRKDG